MYVQKRPVPGAGVHLMMSDQSYTCYDFKSFIFLIYGT